MRTIDEILDQFVFQVEGLLILDLSPTELSEQVLLAVVEAVLALSEHGLGWNEAIVEYLSDLRLGAVSDRYRRAVLHGLHGGKNARDAANRAIAYYKNNK